MKITELIAKLNEILIVEGDLDVTCWPYDGQARTYDLNEIDVYDVPSDPRWNEPARRVVSLDH